MANKVFRFNKRKRTRPASLVANDSAVGSSPSSRQRTMSGVAGAVVRYGPRAIAAATRIQRAFRNQRTARHLFSYARGLRRLYNRYGRQEGNRMTITVPKYIKKGNALPNQNTNRYRLTRMAGSYGGKFKKPRKLSRKVNPYLTKGFENTTEVTGTVTDPNCVYMAASSISSTHAIDILARALLRRAFEKCVGYPITNVHSTLQGYQGGAAPFHAGDGFLFQLTWITVNSTTGEAQDTYVTGVTDTIYSITGDAVNGVAPAWTGLMNKLKQWAGRSSTGSGANTEIPLRLNVYRRDGNVTLFYLGSGGLDLRNMTVHFESTSAIKVQNRSVSATGSASTDVVDSNPLVGYLYEFKGGVPMFKNLDQQSGTLRLNRIFDIDAVITIRGGEFPGTATVGSGWVNNEPPKPRFFSNCVKSSKVMIKPGDIKTHFIKYTTKLKFVDYLMKIANINDGSSVKQTTTLPGKCVMFALEDMINVNAASLIAISYEVNRVDKCYVSESVQRVAQGTFAQRIQNNLTP